MSYRRTYYIEDTRQRVGNSVMWWAPDGKGYTCDLRCAGVYDEEEAKRIAGKRGTDRLWPVGEVMPLIQFHIDHQDLYAERRRRVPHTVQSHLIDGRSPFRRPRSRG